MFDILGWLIKDFVEYSRLHYNAYKWDHDEANALACLCTRYMSRLCDKWVTSCD